MVGLIPDGILTIDKSGIITAMNKAVFEITGFSEEELVGKHISKVPVLSLKDVPNALAVFGSMIIGKGPALVEIPCKKKDGTPRIGEFRVSLIKTAGKTTGIQVIARDITERKQAELKLQESQKKFQALVETTNDFIWEMNLNGVYTYCSPQMERLWGLKPEEMLGKTPFDLLPPEDREQAIKAFSAVFGILIPLYKYGNAQL